VLEEYTRFVRNDGPASYRLKQMRHQLCAAVGRLGATEMLDARDVAGDVGAMQASPSDRLKVDAASVAVAAAKRLPEALRAIEEYSRTVDAKLSQVACRLRYDAYDLEKRVFAVGNLQARLQDVRLYLLLTADLCREDPIKLADKLLKAGVDCIQLREKQMSDRRFVELAGQLRQVCLDNSAVFIVNDRPDVAAIVGADGVHVGQDDLPIAAIRRLLAPEAMVGVSAHNIQQVRCALDQCADYVAIGPAFATDTKPHEPAVGLEFIASAVKLLDEAGVSHLAIGGVSLANLPQLLAVGVRRLAVCSAILSADDPAAAARQFADLLHKYD